MRRMRLDICLRKTVSSHRPGKKAERGEGGGVGIGKRELSLGEARPEPRHLYAISEQNR